MTADQMHNFNQPRVFSILKVVVLCATALSPLVSTTAWAADEGKLEEIIVTAQKRAENLQTIPIAVSAFDGNVLEDRNITNVSDLPLQVPNLLVSQGAIGVASSANFNIRGIGNLAGWTPSNEAGVGTYVDGVFYARSLGGALDLGDIDRIEVLRGPQGTLFGRNTTGGAVNIITQKPNFSGVSGKLNLAGGLFTQAAQPFGSLRGSFNAPLSERIAVRVSVIGKVSDGWGKSSAPGLNQKLGKDGDVAGKFSILYRPEDNLEVIASADRWHRRGTGSPSVQIAGPDAGPENPQEAHLSQSSVDNVDSWGTSLTATLTLDALTVKSITAYRELKGLTGGDADGSTVMTADALTNYRQNQFSQELQFSGNFLENRINWLIGGYVFTEHGKFDQNAIGFGTPILFHFDNGTVSYAGFGQASAKITDRLTFTGGLRYTHEQKTFDALTIYGPFVLVPQSQGKASSHAVSPKFSIDYKITDDLMTYASFSRGFRSGGFNGQPTSALDLTPFRPETISSYEAGIKAELFDDTVRLNIAGFYSKYDDIQVSATVAINNVFSTYTTNAAKATIKGLEVEGRWEASSDLSVYGSLGILDTGTLKPLPGFTAAFGGKLPQASKLNSVVGFEYRIPESHVGLSFGADWSYRSSYFFGIDNSRSSIGKAYHLVNARIKMQPPGRPWSLSIYAKNLTDSRYRTVGLDIGTTSIVAIAPTRSVGLEFGYEF